MKDMTSYKTNINIVWLISVLTILQENLLRERQDSQHHFEDQIYDYRHKSLLGRLFLFLGLRLDCSTTWAINSLWAPAWMRFEWVDVGMLNREDIRQVRELVMRVRKYRDQHKFEATIPLEEVDLHVLRKYQ